MMDLRDGMAVEKRMAANFEWVANRISNFVSRTALNHKSDIKVRWIAIFRAVKPRETHIYSSLVAQFG